MRFREYQDRALQTRQTPAIQAPDPVVPLLGLAGEVGELLSEYKKHLRDGEAHKLFEERVEEELGDLLWYIADVADLYDLDMEKVTLKNLEKCRDRWGTNRAENVALFDGDFPESQRFPRRFEITISTIEENGRTKVCLIMNGTQLGDSLTDNSYEDDGYRYHDVFHLACTAILGWSPVIRKLLGRKRKSKSDVDEVQDGGRARVIEEGISALVFSYAVEHDFLNNVKSLNYDLLRTIKGMTKHLEVAVRTPRDWELTILKAYDVWRVVKQRGEGTVVLDLYQRMIHLKE